MPETNSFLSGLFSTIGDAWLGKQQQKHAEELDAKKSQMAIIQAAIPHMADPTQGLQALMDLTGAGKGKGKSGKENPGARMLQTVVGASANAHGQQQQQPPPIEGDSVLPEPAGAPAQQMPAVPTPFRMLSLQDKADIETKQYRDQQAIAHANAMELARVNNQAKVDAVEAKPLTAHEAAKVTLGSEMTDAQRAQLGDDWRPGTSYAPTVRQDGTIIGWRPVSTAQTSQDRQLSERVAELKALDAQSGKTPKSDEEYADLARVESLSARRAALTQRIESTIGTRLSNDIKTRMRDGNLTPVQALTLARQLTAGQTGLSLDDLFKIQDTILTETGSSAAGVGAPPQTQVPASGSNPTTPIRVGNPPASTAPAATDVRIGKDNKLTAQGVKTIETVNRADSAIQDILSGISNPNADSLKDWAETKVNWARYSMGFAGNDPITPKLIQLQKFLSVELPSAFVTGSRAMKFIEQIQQHLPQPQKDTPKLIVEKLQTIQHLIQEARAVTNDVERPISGQPFKDNATGLSPVPKPASAKPPQNPSKGTVWQSPTGPVEWDGVGAWHPVVAGGRGGGE